MQTSAFQMDSKTNLLGVKTPSNLFFFIMRVLKISTNSLVAFSIFVLMSFVLHFCRTNIQPPLERTLDNAIPIVSYPDHQAAALLSQIFNFKEYILLDSTYLLGSITKSLIVNDRIYIGDLRNTMNIMVFDSKGVFQYKIDLKKDYHAAVVFDFSVSNDGQVVVLMDQADKLHFFTQEGNYNHAIKLPFRSFKVQAHPKGRMLIYGYKEDTRKYVFAQWIDYQGNICSGEAGFESYSREVCPAYANLNYPLQGEEPLFSLPLNDTLFRVNTDRLQPLFRFDFGIKAVQNKSIFSQMSYPDMLQHLSLSDNRYGMDMIYESENYIHVCIIDEKYWKSVYYEKNTGKIHIIGKESDDLFNGHFAHIPYATLPDDRFVFILEPMKLHLSSANGAQALHPLLQEIKAKTHKLSNPVLLIGQFRHHSNPI
jgi:hypothetical protein